MKKTVDVKSLYEIIEAQAATIKLLTETVESLRKSTGAGGYVFTTPNPCVPYVPPTFPGGVYIGDVPPFPGSTVTCGGTSSASAGIPLQVNHAG